MDKIPHDEFCGVNPQTDCPECQPRTIQLRRLEHLEERLRKADIFGCDFAELMWIWLEPLINDRIEAMMGRVVEQKVLEFLRSRSFHWRFD